MFTSFVDTHMSKIFLDPVNNNFFSLLKEDASPCTFPGVYEPHDLVLCKNSFLKIVALQEITGAAMLIQLT